MNGSIIEAINKYPECIEKLEVVLNPWPLADTRCWPVAVEPPLIVDESDPAQVEKRGRSILYRFVRDDVIGRRLLDFGTGHSACWKFAEDAEFSIGYDIDPTTDAQHDWEVVLRNKPYHIIIMYDVLDHLVNSDGSLMTSEQMIIILQSLKSILAPDGKLYMRCHPWLSRHGTHAYRNKNKAFIQFLTPEYDSEPTHKIMTPNWTYDNLVQASGFRVIQKIPHSQPVEEIFHTFLSWGQQFPGGEYRLGVMAYTFIDYILGH